MEKKNNNGVLIGLLIGIIIMLLVFIGLFATNTISFNTKETTMNNQTKENNQSEKAIKSNNTVEEKEISKKELVNKLKGIWKHQNEDGVNYAIRVTQDNSFSYGRYGTDGGIYGEIKEIKLISKNIYDLTIFSPSCHGNDCMSEKEDETYILSIDITNIEQKKFKININNIGYKEYEYVGDTWEEVADKFELR